MLQNWITGVIVVLAALYSVWYVLPAALRQKLGRVHPGLGPQEACASCRGCGGCAAGAKPKGSSAEQVIKFYH